MFEQEPDVITDSAERNTVEATFSGHSALARLAAVMQQLPHVSTR